MDVTSSATRALPGDSAERKQVPMASGLLDYFPDALAEIAHVSFLGNEKHNPGEPLHWARGKSMDHADCIVRHLTERGSRDPAGVRHSAQMAWRALALLQQELEAELALPLPRGAKETTMESFASKLHAGGIEFLNCTAAVMRAAEGMTPPAPAPIVSQIDKPPT